jgi:DNA-binding CsgD family transcriptional regulator
MLEKPARPFVVADGRVYVALPTLKLDRNRRIVEMFAAGMSKGDIAAQFGISTPRVHQILKKMARMEAILAGAANP